MRIIPRQRFYFIFYLLIISLIMIISGCTKDGSNKNIVEPIYQEHGYTAEILSVQLIYIVEFKIETTYNDEGIPGIIYWATLVANMGGYGMKNITCKFSIDNPANTEASFSMPLQEFGSVLSTGPLEIYSLDLVGTYAMTLEVTDSNGQYITSRTETFTVNP